VLGALTSAWFRNNGQTVWSDHSELGKREYGVMTACAQTTRWQSHLGSDSTQSRRTSLTRIAAWTGSIRSCPSPCCHQVGSSAEAFRSRSPYQTEPPLTSTTTTPPAATSTMMSASWSRSGQRSAVLRPGSRRVAATTCRTRAFHRRAPQRLRQVRRGVLERVTRPQAIPLERDQARVQPLRDQCGVRFVKPSRDVGGFDRPSCLPRNAAHRSMCSR